MSGWGTRIRYIYVRAVAVVAMLFGVLVGTSASAQSVSQSIPALANIAGLSNLAVSNVQTNSQTGVVTGTVTVKGESATVVGFKLGNNSAAAVIPAKFKLTDFVPLPNGTPLSNVSFKNAAFIVLPAGAGNGAIAKVNLPGALSGALAGTGTHISLKDGVSLIGPMTVPSTGPVTRLLAAIGHNGRTLPLVAPLPSDLFSYNLIPPSQQSDDQLAKSRAMRAAILDSLDFNLSLPSVTLAGLPGAEPLTNSTLSVKSRKKTTGTGQDYDLGIAGGMNIDLKGKKIPFAVGLTQKPTQTGASELDIAGTSSQKVTMEMFRTFDIDGLSFAASRNDNKWTATVDGKTKLNNKDIDVTVNIKPGATPAAKPVFDIAVKTPMAVTDVIPAMTIQGFSDITLENLIVRDNQAAAAIKVRGTDADILYFRDTPSGPAKIAVMPKAFKLADYIPVLAGTPMDAASFDNMSLIWVGAGQGQNNVAATSITQKPLADRLTAAGTGLDFKPGLNLFGVATFPATSDIGTLLTGVGMTSLKLPLRGTIAGAMFSTGGGATARNAILDTLDLTLPLGALKPPGMPAYLNFADKGILHLDGANTNGQRTFQYRVKDAIDITVAGKKATFAGAFSLNKTGQQSNIELNGTTTDSLSFPGFTAFDTKTLGLNAARNGNVWTVKMAATAALNNKDIDLTATLKPGQGAVDYDIIIDTNLTVAEYLGGGFNTPGLSAIELEKIEITQNWAETRIKTHDQEADIVFWRNAPSAKAHIAVLPDAFNLSTLIAPLNSTLLSGGGFTNTAFVWVPTGQAAKSSATPPTGMPAKVTTRLKANAATHAYKAGLNLFGSFAASPSGKIGALLSKVGVSNLTLPLSGTIDPSLFTGGQATGQAAQAILSSVDITAPLPKLSISGAPVAFKNAHFSVKGGTGGVVDVKVLGDIDVTMASKAIDFTFDIDVNKTEASSSDLTISAASTTPVTLPLFHNLALTGLNLTAARAGNAWDTTIDAKSTLNAKPVDIAIKRPTGSPQTVNVTTKMTLADMMPGAVSVPGLTDIEFDSIQVTQNAIDIAGKVKGLDVDVDVFKPAAGAKEHIAVNFPSTFTIATFIPQVTGTPLADAGFKDMNFIWTPKDGATASVAKSALPGNISANISKSSTATSVSLKPGLNLFGNLEIKSGDKIGSLLKKIGVDASSLPLKGSLSDGVFATGNLADTLLDALDITAPLPKLAVSGAPLTFKDAHFAIKGKHVGANRSVDVSVKGEIDVTIASKAIDFTFDIDINKTQGSSSDLEITASSTTKVTLPLFKSLELTGMDLTATRTGGKWDTTIDAKSTLDAKPIDIAIKRPAGAPQTVNVTTKLTLADMIPGGESVPGLTDIEFDAIEVTKSAIEIIGKVKGLVVDVDVFKPGASAKEHIAVNFPSTFTIATFIPQVTGTPLADAGFKDMNFIWTPKSGATASIATSALPGNISTNIGKSSTATSVSLKPGLNLFGNLEIKSGDKIGDLLKKIGVDASSLPLKGSLSDGVFAKGNLADTLLDALDISAPLPKLAVPDVPVTFKDAHFAIKGKHVGANRSVDVSVKGEIDVTIASKAIDFTFDIDINKTQGSSSDLTITADSTSTVTLPLFKSLALTGMDLTATRTGGKWDTTIDAKSSLDGKPIDISIRRPAGEAQTVNVTTKLTLANMIPGGESVPGLTDIEFDTIQVTKDTVDITGKVKELAVDIDVFKPGASAKEHIAVAFPDTFTIATFIPQVSGTPLADAGFKDMNFIWTPKSGATASIATSALPKDISTNIAASSTATSVNLKPGLNLFGNLEIKSGDKIGDLLKKIGVNASSLPLKGSLSAGVFAKGNLADTLLDALDISAPLPKLSVSGAPVKFKNGHFAIKGKHVDGKRSVDVAVKGEVDVNIASKAIDFTFDIDINKTKGGSSDITITADSTKSVTLPLFKSLVLTSLDLTATRTGGKWDTTIKADSSLNNKKIDIAIRRPAGEPQTVNVTTKLTLADMIPGGASVPGLTDVEFDTIQVTKDTVDVTGKLKKLAVDIDLFKPGAGTKEHVAVAFPDTFTIATFIPQVSGTPLADAGFKDMSFIWTPKADAAKTVQMSVLPDDISSNISKSSKASSVSLKPGLTVFGNLEIKAGDKIGDMLKKIGVNASSLPLNGSLSTGVFAKGNLADTLLDALDISAPLPKLSVSGAPVKFKDGHFAIKGKHVDGKRSVDVSVKGEVDINIASKAIDFTFDIDINKTKGGSSDITITADSTKSVTLPLFKSLALTSMDLTATRTGGKWDTTIKADAKMKAKDIDVVIHRPSGGAQVVNITTTLTLADMIPGGESVPGLTDIEFDTIEVTKNTVDLTGKIKKLDVGVALFKPVTGAKEHVGVTFPNAFTIATFIPQVSGTALADASFEDMTFIWTPKSGATRSVKASALPGEVGTDAAKSASTVNLKPGLAVLGNIDVSKSTKISNLLKKLSISKDKLALNGGLSTGIFKKGNLADTLLDALDITAPLPAVSISGSPLSFKKSHFSIKGKHVDGKREVDVALKGDLDFKIASKDINFAFVVDATKESGAGTDVTITADSTSAIKVPFFEPLTLTSMDLTAARKGGKWTTTVDADSKLNNKDIDVTVHFDPKAGRSAVIKANLTLADLMPGGGHIPGLSDIGFTSANMNNKFASFTGSIKKLSTTITTFKRGPGSKRHIGVTFGDFDVASFIPGAEHTPLKDVTFDGATFIWAPKGSAENNVATNVFPKPLAAGLTRAGRTTQDLKAGLNLFAHLVAKPSGTMESLMKDVGVSAASFKLGGGLSSQVFKKGISGSAIKNAIMKSLDLKLPIPTPKIPGLSSIVAFKNGHLRIRGTRPDKTIGLDVGVSGDVDVHIKGHTLDFYVDVEDTKEAGVKDFTITGDTLTPWNKPFGIHWLDLKKLALTVDKKTGAGTDKFSIKVAAKVDVGSNSNMDITAVVKESNGKVTDAYFEMDGPLKLSDIPEINRIPNSSKFTLTKLIVSEHGIEADSTIGGRATDAFVFTGSGWNIALTQKDFALTELIHGLKETPLKYIKLPHAAVVLSETGISNKPFNQLNKVAQDAMKDIFGGTGGMVNIKKGLAVIASFDPAGAGSMKKAINGIGVHEKVVIMGEIGGIFGGSPMINLVGTLSSAGKPGNMPKFMKLSKNDQLDFFLSVLETEGDFDFELGLGVGFTAKVKDKTLEFLGKVKIQIMDEGFGIDIVGKMEGLWHKPFDIPGFSLGDVTIEAGTQEDGAIKLGFAGTTVIANDKFTMAADAELLPEALGAPQAIAFKATADEIPMFFLEQVALSVTGKVVKFEMPKGILPVFKKVSFAFATPGSADPDLGITGEGFGMAGQMDWLGHELGSMKVSIGPTSGLYANAAIDDLNLGPLHLKDNNFTMKAVPLKVPTLKLNSNIKFIGIKENVHVKFDAKGVTFKSDVKFGKDFGMKTDLELKGIDLSATHPSFKHADFFMSGDLKLDIGKFIAGPATKAINDALGELNKAFKKGEADVKKAQKKVDHLTNKINAERAKVRRERAHAEARVRSAENRVNSLTNSINYDWHRYHHCHGWKKDWCKAKWGIRARFEEGVRWGADKILDAVRELVAHFPIDLDPEVAFWIGLRDSAKGVLYVAEKAIEGLDDLDKVVEKIIDKLTGDLKNSVNINKASFSGDLKGIIEHDAPLDLAIDAEFFGLHLKDTFAFKVKDVPYDVEYLGLMGLIALDDLLVKGIVDMTKPLKNKIVGVVSKNIEKKMAAVKRELAKYAAKFNKYNATAAAIQARNAAFNKEYIKAQMAKNQSPIDYDPKSQTFKDEFMEIGHSGLCLTADSGTLMQYNCGRDDKKASQKWTTKPVKDKDVAKYGYVYLTQGSGCVAPEGKWKNVEKKFGEFSFPEPEFQGDGNIVVGGCDESKEYFWKILKHGDHWLYIANRATGQCLVFNDSNAVPGKAKANWAPCTGSANEVFRIADSVTPKYYHANMLLRSDSGGKCFGTPRDKDGYSPMVDCKHGARYDYLIDIRGDVRFVNRTTGKCLQPKGYKETDKVFEKTCTQLDFQWWSPIQVPGGWMIRNAQTNWCTESVYWGKSPDVQQGVCKNYGYNVITPVFAPETGVLWEPVSTAAFPSNRVKFDTAYTIKEREAKYTLKIHNEERAKLARLEANEKWAAAHKEKQCNPTANYWLRYWRARLHVGGWFADIIRLKARAEIDAILGSGWCKIKLDPWAKKNVQVDDYDIKVIQARLKKNVVPPPEPKWYACRAFDRAYEAWVPGVVDNRKCVFVEPWSGRVKSATKYDIVYDAVDVQWVRNTGGHLPTYAIPMGNTTRPKDNTLYSCRTMVDTKTFVGWTSLGKKCWYEKVGPKHSTNFEVLSRDSRTVYKLDLGD